MYNANYMEGVPVKIAEKYKPPPQLYKLPQSLVNKLNLADNYYDSSPQFQYHMQLERKALSKITEWKRIRQRNKDALRERKERRELQRKQEDEQRQKNLLCSVSYPSTDDLSSTGSEGEEEPHSYLRKKSKESAAVAECVAPQICLSETSNSFHNILQPTVLSNYNTAHSITSNNSINSIHGLLNPLAKTSTSSAFNYKDFEDDTSSPFDNIELKTINDLDVLAQVLHNTQIKPTPAEELPCDNDDLKATALENANGVNVQEQAVTKPSDNIPKHNNLPKFTYDFDNLNNAQKAQNKLNNYTAGQMFSNSNFSPSLPCQAYILQGQQTQHNLQYNPGMVNTNNYYHNVNAMQINNINQGGEITQEEVAKSKSVPDILKELREEIRNSEIRRTRNCSQNLENGTQNQAVLSVAETGNVAGAVENIFDELDSKSRQLAEQISSMGFPKLRVSRIVQLLGADDKKIIEHLIPLSELADLGFDECKISEALMRHENNKNKALDDLIS